VLPAFEPGEPGFCLPGAVGGPAAMVVGPAAEGRLRAAEVVAVAVARRVVDVDRQEQIRINRNSK